MNRFLKFLTRTTNSKESSDSEDEPMYLIVGLGNPGDQYEHTRHNAGFDTIDILAKDLGVKYWKNECGAITGKATYHDMDILLAKPMGYMNTSGGPVKQLCNAYGIEPDKLIIIHDEIDIDPGTIRVKLGGGHAGHNGLRSICDKLNTRDWYRIRIGVGRPPGRMNAADYVLTVPRKEAMDDFNQACYRGAEATLSLLDNGLEETQQKFN